MLPTLQSLLPQLQDLCHKELFLVTSVGKSGSTWVQKILDSHPLVYCGGEGKFQNLLSHSLDTFKKYNAEIKKSNHLIYGDHPYYSDWQDHQVHASIQFFMALIFLNTQKPIPPQTQLIGDKDTGYILNFKVWHHTVLPQAKIIHVIRDVRDAIVSNYFHLKRQGNTMSIGDQNFHHFVRVFSATWRDAILTARLESQTKPSLYHEVFYEKLKQSPHQTAKQLFNFLGVKITKEQVSHCIQQTSFKNLSGGRQPGEPDQNSFYRKGVVGDWQNHLDPQSLHIIYSEASQLLQQLNYQISK